MGHDTWRYLLRKHSGYGGDPNERITYGQATNCNLVLRHNSQSVLDALIEVLAYHDIEHFNFHRGMQGWLYELRRKTVLMVQDDFERELYRKKAVRPGVAPRFHCPNPRIDAAVAMMAANYADLEARINPDFDHIFKNHPSLMTHISTPIAKSPELFAKMYGAGPATLDKIKENTMSNTKTQPGQFTQREHIGFDSESGEALYTEREYRSRIIPGSELEVGGTYRLEIVGGKNPPEIAKAGSNFKALGDSNGDFIGDVLDVATNRVFQTDESDLWLQA